MARWFPAQTWRMSQTLRTELIELAKTLLTAGLIALAIRTVIVEPFYIPSSSMEPGLITGDYLLVSKSSYGWSHASLPFDPPLFKGRILGRAPRRGEVVVFRSPSEAGKVLIKRLVGLPGDHVRLSGGQVSVNGVPYRWEALGPGLDRDDPGRPVKRVRETQPDGRSYVTFDGGLTPQDDTGEFVVPAGRYFMLGDNRDNSLDSRFPAPEGFGFVPAEDLLGPAKLVLLSWDKQARPLAPWTWRLHLDRFFKPIG